MIFRFILFLFLAGFQAHAEDSRERTLQKISEDRYCDFDATKRNYNAGDLLQCIDKLSVNLADKESGRSSNEGGKSDKLSYRQKPFWSSLTDSISSIFNGNSYPEYQTSALSSGMASSYYQSNYPSVSEGTLDLPGGIGVNLFDALSSISRYDDYKCVPRILCEVASGRLPGQSLGKQSSNAWDNLGRNVFMDWLATYDIGGNSPILNFARATILGYTNRGSSAMCYRAFPRCPSDPDELVHYLNNHNGGFFRFFDKYRGGNYQKYPPPYNKKNMNYYRNEYEELRNRIHGRGPNKIRSEEQEKRIIQYSGYRIRGGNSGEQQETTRITGKVVFPDS